MSEEPDNPDIKVEKLTLAIEGALLAIEEAAYGGYVSCLNDAHAILSEALGRKSLSAKISRTTVVYRAIRDPLPSEVNLLLVALKDFRVQEVLPGSFTVFAPHSVVEKIITSMPSWQSAPEGRVEML